MVFYIMAHHLNACNRFPGRGIMVQDQKGLVNERIDTDLYCYSEPCDLAECDASIEALQPTLLGRSCTNSAILYNGAPLNGVLYNGAPLNGVLYIMAHH